MGSDGPPTHTDNTDGAFQSTLPVWGATPSTSPIPLSDSKFQSTLPVWGATAYRYQDGENTKYFNPRSPCGERLFGMKTSPILSSYFNPRSPCGERRSEVGTPLVKLYISIHAPRVGSDLVVVAQMPIGKHFNPRSPCGERLMRSPHFSPPCLFQSTLPVWGATLS